MITGTCDIALSDRIRSSICSPLMSWRPRSSTMQSNCFCPSCSSASSPEPTAVICTSRSPISSTSVLRCTSSSSMISSVRSLRSLNSRIASNASFSDSFSDGLAQNVLAPSRMPRCGSSVTEMTCTGMCRVLVSCFRRSSTFQPSMPGMSRSSVIASGRCCRAICRPMSPRTAARTRNSCSRPRSIRMRAKA